MARLAIRTCIFLGWILFGLTAPQATAQTLADFVVEAPRAEMELFPWGSGRLATFGSLSGFLYRSTSGEDWLYLQDSAGHESHIRLPEKLGRNDRANAEYVLTSGSDLWLWSGIFGASRLRHFRLTGDGPLPERALLVSSTLIGDRNTRPGGLIALASGGALGVWYQFEYHSDHHIDIGFVYARPDGGLFQLFPLRGEGRGGSIIGSRWTLVQHPADGGIWAFYKRDSYHEISAIHLTETDSSIRVDWIEPAFIDREDGGHAPESEYPFLVAAPDPRRNSIRLAYQNRKFILFYVADDNGVFKRGSCAPTAPGVLDPALFSKGAKISIAEIGAKGEKSFLDFPFYVEATRYFGLAVTDRLWLVFLAIGCENTTFESLQKSGSLYLSGYRGGWSRPELLGELDSRKDYYASPLLFNITRPEFVVRLKDGRVHDFEGF